MSLALTENSYLRAQHERIEVLARHSTTRLYQNTCKHSENLATFSFKSVTIDKRVHTRSEP
jgi:hypothetical protein